MSRLLITIPLLCAALLLPAASSALVEGAAAPPSPAEAALALYGVEGLLVEPRHDGSFRDAFPRHELYRVQPPGVHARGAWMAYDPSDGDAYDATGGFNALLADAGLSLADDATALRAAKAYARLADGDLQEDRRLLRAADASRLGVPVADPSLVATALGREARLHAWSPENGVVSSWTVALTASGVSGHEWRVLALARGHHHVELAAPALRAGTRVVGAHDLDGYRREAYQVSPGGVEYRVALSAAEASTPSVQTVVERSNFDGSKWVTNFRAIEGVTTPVDLLDVAKALTEAGVEAYAQQVVRNPHACANLTNPSANWGFESRDPDCTLIIEINDHAICFSCVLPNTLNLNLRIPCMACVGMGDHVYIWVSSHIREDLYTLGLYTDLAGTDVYDLAPVVMGHEFFHTLQFAATNQSPTSAWGSMIEGQARFQQTLTAAATEQQPTSLWYHSANEFYQASPESGFCMESYGLAPFWGYLHAHDGGIGTLQDVLELAPQMAGATCEVRLSAAIDAALANATGPHDTLAQAMVGYALAAYARDLSWGTPTGGAAQDWTLHLDEVTKPAQGLGSVSRAVGSYGFQFVRLPDAGTYAIDCAAGSGWTFRLVTRSAAGVINEQAVACGTPVTVNGASHAEVVFNAVRTATNTGTYTLTVT